MRTDHTRFRAIGFFFPCCIRKNIEMKKFENLKLVTFRSNMDRLFSLRTDQIVKAKCIEIDHVVEYSIERLPPAVRAMRLDKYLESDEARSEMFPASYVGPRDSRVDSSDKILDRTSFCCQTSPASVREHQTQTPVYTAHKRSRSEMENVELVSKIRTQLAQEAQHVVLPATAEYFEMPPQKKQQIVSILTAIVSTYEGIQNNEENLERN